MAPDALTSIFSGDLSSFETIETPTRLKRGKFLDPVELQKHLDIAATEIGKNPGVIVILFDADDDAECEIGPRVYELANQLRSDIPIVVSAAKYEYEVYFLASLESLRGFNGVPRNARSPASPESIRDAKGYMRSILGRKYSPTVDQPEFTKAFDIRDARTVPSFERLCSKIRDLLRTA